MTLGELADTLAQLEDLTKQRNRTRVPIYYRKGELTKDEYRDLDNKRQQRLNEQVRAININ